MPYAEVNGQRLFFQDTGGDGPPIVLSHGFLLDHEMFTPQVEDLSDVYRVITWDQRGFGRTESDGEPFTFWDSARDVFALLDALGIERAVVGGVSQGGYLSLRAALLHPDRVRALIPIATQTPLDPPEKTTGYREMVDVWIAKGYRDHVGDQLAERLLGGDPSLAAGWQAKWAALDPNRLTTAVGALVARDDITDRLDELAMPVLVIHGAEDTSIPIDRAHELCARVPDCRGVVEVAGAPHAPNLTHPDAVNTALRGFLEGLPA